MTDDTDNLAVQTPGDSDPHPRLTAILEGSAADVADALDTVDGAELDVLLELEAKGKARKGVLNSIVKAQSERAASAPPAQSTTAPDIGGNTTDYRHLPATAVDPRKIRDRVLTKDGWVVPAPFATEG